MCLFPRVMENKKYTANKKNGGVIPAIPDKRVLYISVGCQECVECRTQKANGWRVRLQEEIKVARNGKFVTLTFSDEKYIETKDNVLRLMPKLKGYDLENEIATYAMRHFLENWRKKMKKSVRHWMVTELGQESTENIHIHGIIWTNEVELMKQKWNYGHAFIGNYVSERTVNYIVKYVNKIDEKHRYYKSKILTSAGIGASYIGTINSKNNIYKDMITDESYRTRSGHRLALPTYYRNKIYSDEERERLWIEKLDKNERYIRGVKCLNDYDYAKGLIRAQAVNNEMGFGDGGIDWEQKKYEEERRAKLQIERFTRMVKNNKDIDNGYGFVVLQDGNPF